MDLAPTDRPMSEVPPPLPPTANASRGTPPHFLVLLLNLCFVLFLADGIVSLLDDTLIVLSGQHSLAALRAMVFLVATLLAVVIYLLMGITPMIPKRFFLPITLFNVAAALLALPLYIYAHSRFQQITWAISLLQVIFALVVLRWMRGKLALRWPFITGEKLNQRGFSWLNMLLFLLANAVIVVPGIAAYLFFCAGLAADHFSDGFVRLNTQGLAVQARTYLRQDGKTVQLVPMAHVGEPDFYWALSKSFPTNSVILMEGVTDDEKLLTNRITYQRTASSLGLSEQQTEFKPNPAEFVWADVDVGQFSTNTINFLNLVMRVHARGLNAETVLPLLQYSPPPGFEQELMNDLLRKRNHRVLEELNTQLSQSDYIIIPWGAAHMPEIAKQIQKDGFHLQEKINYQAIRFHPPGSGARRPDKVETPPSQGVKP
jgi:hypothetical protein